MAINRRYLSKREQQIMEIAYEMEQITALDLVERLPGSPSNSTVRTLLRILEEKGELSHIEQDGRYLYSPVRSRQAAARTALTRLVDTLFKGSVTDAVSTLMNERAGEITTEELDELQRVIDKAREEGR